MKIPENPEIREIPEIPDSGDSGPHFGGLHVCVNCKNPPKSGVSRSVSLVTDLYID